MKALLWKDWQVNRTVLQAAAVGFLVPYLVGTFVNLLSLWRTGQGQLWSELLAFAALWSLGISFATITFLGSNAIAGERADRSAEFLAYLPVPRRAALGSRIVVALGPAVLVWLVNLALVYGMPHWAAQWAPESVRNFIQIRHTGVSVFAVITVLAVGVAWFCTSRLRSPSISAALGLLAPVLLLLPLATIKDIANVRHIEFDMVRWYMALAPSLGVIFFVAGCVHYVRRVEP
jgi:ABC-type transport system involved in multi-copper enzyme maturation permease subunit